MRSKTGPVRSAIRVLAFLIVLLVLQGAELFPAAHAAAVELPVAALHHAAASVPDWHVTASEHSAGLVVPVEDLTVLVGMESAVELTFALDGNKDAQL